MVTCCRRNVMFLSRHFLFWNVSQNLLLLKDEIRGKIIRKLTFQNQMLKQNTGPSKSSEWHRWLREEITVRKLGTSPIPDLDECVKQILRNPHPHGRTVPWNTIKIPHIPPPWPRGGGGGIISIEKCIMVRNLYIKMKFRLKWNSLSLIPQLVMDHE